jgi:D-threo-aldose 1-dehydrogenase
MREPGQLPIQSRSTTRGLPLTELGLGVAQFGNLYRETTDDEAHGAFEAAWTAGIRYYDVAPHYGVGLAERRLGALLQTRPRDDFVISTKVGRLLVEDPGATGLDTEGFVVPATTKRRWDFSRDGILRSLEQSLERLGLDRIDILYLHDPDEHWTEASGEAVPALLELREQGVIRAFGAGMNQSAMPARFVREFDLDLVMLAGRYTLLEQPQDDLMSLAAERGVGIVIAGVYNSGLLAKDRPDPGANYNYEAAPADLVARANRLADICEKHGVTLPEAALAFPLRHPAVVSVVVGGRTARQVEGSVARYAAAVPDVLWAELAAEGLIPSEVNPEENR